MSTEQLTYAAIQLSAAGQQQQAYQLFAQVTKLLPTDAGAWLNLGICALALADYSAAAEAFTQASTLAPTLAAAYTNLAATWVARGELETAIAVLDQGLQHNPAHAALLGTKAALLAQLGEISAADVLLTQAHSLAPEDASVLLLLAELKIQQHQFAAALPLLKRQSWAQHPQASRYYLAQARASYGCRDSAAATVALTQAKAAGAEAADALLQQVALGWGAPLSSRRLDLQPLQSTHAAEIFTLQNDVEAWRHYSPHGLVANTVAALAREIHRRYASPTLPPTELAWAVYSKIGDTPKFVGICQLTGIDQRNRRAEVLMLLQERSQGYGIETLLLLLHAYFYRYAGNKLQLLVLDSNATVLDIVLRLGFKQEGCLQQQLFDAATQQYTGIHQLALCKADLAHCARITHLSQRFGITST